MSQRTCKTCGVELPESRGPGRPRTRCVDCVKPRRRRRQDSATLKCATDECDRFVRARGLCAKHYTRLHRPSRKGVRLTPVAVECAACGAATTQHPHAVGRYRPACSYRCRYHLTNGRDIADGREVVGPVARLPRSAYWPTRDAALPSLRRTFVSGACEWCGEVFTRALPQGGALSATCSLKCTYRASRTRARAKRGRFVVTKARRRRLYARDGWTCQLCGDPVDPDLPVLDTWAATLDHIIPQSHMLVPDHSDANLRLAHRWCNSVRGDETYVTAADLAA